MDLQTLHSEISKAIARGTAYDARIPAYAKMAARYIERNYTFQYMNIFATFEVDADAVEPRLITLPARMKKDIFVRLVLDEGEYQPLQKIDPQQQHTLVTEVPTGYFLSGDDRIWLAQTPEEDYDGEIFYTRFTTWPTAPDATNWLLNYADDVLIAQTMVFMAPLLRDPDAGALWGAMNQMAMKSLLDADFELEFSNKPAVMQYGSDNP
jgi:hypothetical protein